MVDKKEEKEIEKIELKHRCKKCNSLFGYYKIKDKTWQCRSCGHVDEEIIL